MKWKKMQKQEQVKGGLMSGVWTYWEEDEITGWLSATCGKKLNFSLAGMHLKVVSH